MFKLASILLAVAISSSATHAGAQILDRKLNPSEIGSVAVALNDNASDACWTNLREVREYAEEKLRSSGFGLSDGRRAMIDYTLAVSVDGYRLSGAPSCFGNVMVMLVKAAPVDGVMGLHVISLETAVATTALHGNLNQRVIEVIQRAVENM